MSAALKPRTGRCDPGSSGHFPFDKSFVVSKEHARLLSGAVLVRVQPKEPFPMDGEPDKRAGAIPKTAGPFAGSGEHDLRRPIFYLSP